VDGRDRGGLRQAQDVAVAPEVAWVIAEPITAEVGFGELVGLEHRPHRPVEDEDPVAQDARQRGQARGPVEGRALPRRAGRRGDGGAAHGVALTAVGASEPVAPAPATPTSSVG